jgi:hypothetical protein
MFWDGNTAQIYESDLAYDKDEDWISMTPDIPDDIMKKAQESSPSCFK